MKATGFIKKREREREREEERFRRSNEPTQPPRSQSSSSSNLVQKLVVVAFEEIAFVKNSRRGWELIRREPVSPMNATRDDSYPRGEVEIHQFLFTRQVFVLLVALRRQIAPQIPSRFELNEIFQITNFRSLHFQASFFFPVAPFREHFGPGYYLSAIRGIWLLRAREISLYFSPRMLPPTNGTFAFLIIGSFSEESVSFEITWKTIPPLHIFDGAERAFYLIFLFLLSDRIPRWSENEIK